MKRRSATKLHLDVLSINCGNRRRLVRDKELREALVGRSPVHYVEAASSEEPLKEGAKIASVHSGAAEKVEIFRLPIEKIVSREGSTSLQVEIHGTVLPPRLREHLQDAHVNRRDDQWARVQYLGRNYEFAPRGGSPWGWARAR